MTFQNKVYRLERHGAQYHEDEDVRVNDPFTLFDSRIVKNVYNPPSRPSSFPIFLNFTPSF